MIRLKAVTFEVEAGQEAERIVGERGIVDGAGGLDLVDGILPSDSPKPNTAAHTDTLDGRATNRYFYRTSRVDPAQNESKTLSLSTPPVYLPTADPPGAPVLVDTGSDDHKVRLSWRSSLDPSVTEYRIYRSASESQVCLLRGSDRVFVLPEPLTPDKRAPVVGKDDLASETGKPFYYAVTAAAVSTTDPSSTRESGPSRIAALTAFDDTHPAPPTWKTPQPQGSALLLSWTTSDTTLKKTLVQRRQSSADSWQALGAWLDAGTTSVLDQTRS